MIVKWTWVVSWVVVLSNVKANEDIELNGIIRDINDCSPSEVEFCMGKWIFKTLKEFSDRPKYTLFEGVVELRKSNNDTKTTGWLIIVRHKGGKLNSSLMKRLVKDFLKGSIKSFENFSV